jgi:hypothetical protein
MANLSQPDGSAQSGSFPSNFNAGPASPASVAATDASSARLASSNINRGAVASAAPSAGSVFNLNFISTNGTALPTEADWRVRISMAPATANLFYASTNPILGPLYQTNGVIFPYTPTIDISHQARWNPTTVTHSNYNSYFYEGSEVSSITIRGEFTVQNIQEGQYLMAAIHFFRSCTKMFFGQSTLAGTPPPVVYLDGFGKAYFPRVPCVVQSFNHQMPAEVDYITVPVGADLNLNNTAGQPINVSGYAIPQRLPTASSLSVTLQPIYSRTNIQNNFTLEGFSRGALLGNGFI